MTCWLQPRYWSSKEFGVKSKSILTAIVGLCRPEHSSRRRSCPLRSQILTAEAAVFARRILLQWLVRGQHLFVCRAFLCPRSSILKSAFRMLLWGFSPGVSLNKNSPLPRVSRDFCWPPPTSSFSKGRIQLTRKAGTTAEQPDLRTK